MNLTKVRKFVHLNAVIFLVCLVGWKKFFKNMWFEYLSFKRICNKIKMIFKTCTTIHTSNGLPGKIWLVGSILNYLHLWRKMS